VREDGKFFTKLNTWEDATIRAELERAEVIRWLRNYERKPWSLCIPYEKGGEKLPTYPLRSERINLLKQVSHTSDRIHSGACF
jgi:hypothetical protein